MAGLDRGTLLALGAMAMAVLVIANDITALSVALPDIEKDFDADVTSVQWVINAYALVFGVLIVTGGRLADMFGRRRMFFYGAAIFALFSLLAGIAQDELWLIACRGLMGVGGAIMWPAVLGMTYELLPGEKAGLAGGLIIGVAGLGNAAGPLIGGALTEAASWRAVMFVNLPIAALACFATWRLIREPGFRHGPRADRLPGHRDADGGAHRAADRSGPGNRLGLVQRPDPGAVRHLRRRAHRVRADRAGRGVVCPDPPRRDVKPWSWCATRSRRACSGPSAWWR